MSDAADDAKAHERAVRLRFRGAEFARLAEDARDGVIREELLRLSLLYRAQAEMLDRGEEPPSDPGR